MRILRALLVFFLVGLLAVAGILYWVQTPSGAKQVSVWVTARLKSSAPGTRVDLEKVKLRWPPALEVKRAVWSDAAGRPLLTLEEIRLAGFRPRLPLGRSSWEGKGQVVRLDLKGLDRVVARGEWRANGFLNGKVGLRGGDGRLQALDLGLSSEQPGGDLNSEILQRLVQMMPAGDSRAMLLKALGAKGTFHFNVGKVDLATDGGDYVLKLLLNGDHLLDLTIRIPKDSLELLRYLTG